MVDHNDGADAPGLAMPDLAHHHPADLAPLGTAAAHAVVTPTSERAPDAANVGGPGEKKTQTSILGQPTDEGKRFATLRARLALKGYSLHRTAGCDGPVCYYVTRWGLLRQLHGLAAVERFLDQVGGANA